MKKSIEELLAAYKFVDLQRVVQIINWLKTNNKNIEDLEEYIKKFTLKNLKKEKKRQKLVESMKYCPDCGEIMQLNPSEDINFCHWTCKKCRKGIPVNSSIEEEVKRIKNGLD